MKLGLVTGATSGIGEALCYLLADKGIDLIITGRNEKKLNELKAFLGNKVKIIPIAADLLIPSQSLKILKAIDEYCPDLVINNAGIGLYGNAIDHTIHEELDVFKINGEAVLEITLEAAKKLKLEKKKGIILNVSSVAAFYVIPGHAVYGAIKAFTLHLSQSLDYELSKFGIRVLAACPGMVDTNFIYHAAKKAMTPERKKFAMTSKEAANHIWWQIQNQKRVYVFNWKYRWLLRLCRFLPKKWTANYLHEEILSRIC